MRTSSAPAKKTTAPRRKVAPPSFQQPLMPEPEPKRPRDHNGVPVEREELYSNLPTGGAFKISKLHLSNGEIAFACRDCTFTGDNRRDIMLHRNELHGAKYGKPTPRLLKKTPDKHITDVVLPPREDGSPAPTHFMERTVGEFLAIAPSLAALGDTFDRLEAERDAALAEVAENRIDRVTQHKIDAYDHLKSEIVELRRVVASQGNYEEIKEELYRLRAWKKKITAKFDSVGFKYEED